MFTAVSGVVVCAVAGAAAGGGSGGGRCNGRRRAGLLSRGGWRADGGCEMGHFCRLNKNRLPWFRDREAAPGLWTGFGRLWFSTNAGRGADILIYRPLE